MYLGIWSEWLYIILGRLNQKETPMPNDAKTGRVDKEEVLRVIELVTETLMAGEKSKEARLELVIALLVQRTRPGVIRSVVSKTFGVTNGTVKNDIAEARDLYVSWYNGRKENELRAESAATMDQAIAMGFKKQDVQGVVSAQKHKDTLHRLIKDEDAPAATLGVLMLPSRKDIKSWQDQFSKPQKSKK
jgi:hypothetical protein